MHYFRSNACIEKNLQTFLILVIIIKKTNLKYGKKQIYFSLEDLCLIA